MKKFIQHIILSLQTFYFVSGTFEHEGERKWFRLIYNTKRGFVNEQEVRDIIQQKTGVVSKYLVVTNFQKTTYRQYLNF